MPYSDDDLFPEEDNYCYPSIIFDPPDSDSDSDSEDLLGKIYRCFDCDDCDDCKTCDTGRCYCPNSINYYIDDYDVYEGHDEVKFSKIDESSDIHRLGMYHLSVCPPHGTTTHNITIINNNCEYDSQFDHNDNNIIRSNYEGVSIHVDEIMNILKIFKNRLDNDD